MQIPCLNCRKSFHNKNKLHRNFEKLLAMAGIDVWDDLFPLFRSRSEMAFAKYHQRVR